MKSSLFFILFMCIIATGLAQDNKTITVNTLQNNTSELTRSLNKYPSFLNGRVLFKDGAFADVKMNFNRLMGQILFIRPKGDTLMLAHPETINKVIIGVDTFYYFDRNFLERITHYDASSNLYLKQTMKYIGNEKKGAYGTYSATTSVNSNTTFTNDDQITQYLSVDENSLFKSNADYYLSDRFNNFFLATKNRFYKIFSNHEKSIREYVDANKTNFNKKEDLVQLLQYIKSL